MAKSSIQTFYGSKGGKRDQVHKTRRQIVKEFVNEWTNKGIIKEDANRQPFIDDLLRRVCGVEQPTQYIQYEKDVLVQDAPGTKPKTKRIDGYIPSTKVLWEMKGSNKKLDKPILQSSGIKLTPFEQARNYATSLPQNEYPKWIVTSNFSQINIYNLNNRSPVPRPKVIMLKDLATKYKELDFLVDTNQQQIIDEKRLSVDAGNLVAKIYDGLAHAYSLHADLDDPKIQKSLNMLIVRLVFLMYADDTGILGEENMFQSFLERREPRDVRPALIELFRTLNEDPEKGERDEFLGPEFKQFKYVNGGMFSNENVIIPQFTQELKDLIVNEASKGFNWANISPTIFGAVFESTLNPETRRYGGMHYTSIENIHKVIDPLFLDDLRAEFNKIQNMTNVNQRVDAAIEFQDKIARLKFMDPACGSGNFLTETYLSLRKLENECLKIIVGRSNVINLGEQSTVKVKVKIQNFYGIEINDFAVSVARTAMWIAESQMWNESQNIIYSKDDFLPLDSNDSIYEGNAIRIDWSSIVKPFELNYIMGNPPFVGLSSLPAKDKALKKQQREDMDLVFGDLKKSGKLDYVSAWYEKSAKYMHDTTIKAALVSTNSITQGEQVGILWRHLKQDEGVHILFAYRSFVWDNEASKKAHVHCVIIGFTLGKTNQKPVIFNEKGEENTSSNINGYLIDYPDVYIQSRKRKLPYGLPEMHKGSQPTDGGGLTLTPKEANELITKYPKLKAVIKPYIGSTELIHGRERFCLWLKDVSPAIYRKIPKIKQRLAVVIHKRSQSTTDSVRLKDIKTPYLFTQIRQPETDYIAVPEVSSENREYIPIALLSKNIIASNKLYLVPTDSKWLFAILSSSVHMAWMRTVAGRLETRYSYSPAVYTNFPWLNFSEEDKKKLSETGRQILDARTKSPDCTLADLYDGETMTSALREAHEANDQIVLNKYGLTLKATEQQIVERLFSVYQQQNKTKD